MMNKHIVIVEDDPVTRSILEGYLEESGFHVSSVESHEAFLPVFSQRNLDLALIDLNLPGKDGLELIQEIRRTSDIGIIVVTSRKEDVDKIVGLEFGADDYVTKPFNQRELLARIKNILRRTGEQGGRRGQEVSRSFCGWTLNMESRTLEDPRGKRVSLTTGEYHLIDTFSKNPGRVFSRSQLVQRVSNREWMPTDRTIDVMISRLRRKIESNPRRPSILITVYGVGYKLSDALPSPPQSHLREQMITI
ncbi:MAG: response regulator transcription factor [Magnetococcales bacterium]|nr:response regulator transcription factor [Magnetococcales bacterium]